MSNKILPGRLHTIILSEIPLKRSYKIVNEVKFDRNIINVGEEISILLKSSDFLYVSLMRDNIVEGRSWEMAAANALLGNDGVFSGTVESITDDMIKYGSVPGIDIKRKIYTNLTTIKEKRYDLLPR